MHYNVHPQGIDQEGPVVGRLFDQLGGWLARAVAGLGLDADQDRARLQPGRPAGRRRT